MAILPASTSISGIMRLHYGAGLILWLSIRFRVVVLAMRIMNSLAWCCRFNVIERLQNKKSVGVRAVHLLGFDIMG
jgi:hypothetical protein